MRSLKEDQLVKRKLCPFDKSECVGELCMLYSGREDTCGLLILCSPVIPQVKAEHPTESRDAEHGARERKSRFKAELFD
jgi:hypothetical protein